MVHMCLYVRLRVFERVHACVGSRVGAGVGA